MNIFDSHCHLNDKAFKSDENVVIERAWKAGVKKIMIVGITEKTSKLAVDIASSQNGCYASVGIHPHDARQYTNTALQNLRRLSAAPAVKAWGETGLDFNRMFSPKDIQENCFARQVEMAKELGLPLIFHERDSRGRFYELLGIHMKKGQKGVVHCFSGTREDLDKYLEMGLYIGFTGIVTNRKRGAQLRQMAKIIPEDRILVETDAPYLTPEAHKNQSRRNEPAFVRSVLMEMAEIRQTAPEKLASVIWSNTCTLFGIDPKKNSQLLP